MFKAIVIVKIWQSNVSARKSNPGLTMYGCDCIYFHYGCLWLIVVTFRRVTLTKQVLLIRVKIYPHEISVHTKRYGLSLNRYYSLLKECLTLVWIVVLGFCLPFEQCKWQLGGIVTKTAIKIKIPLNNSALGIMKFWYNCKNFAPTNREQRDQS